MTTTISPSLGHAILETQQGVGATPGYDAIDDRRMISAGLQEGVIDAGSYEVTQRLAGANMSVDVAASTGFGAYVQGEAVTAQALYRIAPHSGAINEAITAAHATLPRIDRVVLEIKDNLHDASGSNLVQTRVVDGTPTGGATLTNLSGAAAVPNSALLLADVLVDAAAVSITNAKIRDRRTWARGAYCSITRNANAAAGNDYTIASTTLALIDGTNLAPRIECSGVPVKVTLIGVFANSASAHSVYFSPQVDSVGVNGMNSVGASALTAALEDFMDSTNNRSRVYQWEFTPAAGSHILAPAWANSANTTSLRARAIQPCAWIVEEIVRQDTKNNATTTG